MPNSYKLGENRLFLRENQEVPLKPKNSQDLLQIRDQSETKVKEQEVRVGRSFENPQDSAEVQESPKECNGPHSATQKSCLGTEKDWILTRILSQKEPAALG